MYLILNSLRFLPFSDCYIRLHARPTKRARNALSPAPSPAPEHATIGNSHMAHSLTTAARACGINHSTVLRAIKAEKL
jgi:hypothetical protein